MPMPNGGWTKQHDTTKWLLSNIMAECEMDCTTEVFGLFAACIAQIDACNGQHLRKRQAMVPDFQVVVSNKPMLFELKTVHHGKTYFNRRTVDIRNGGVEKRAGTINAEYQKKAREADRKWGPGGGWDRGAQGPGPVEQRLAEFGQVRSLVVGPRGEVSKDMVWLVSAMATVGAERKWRTMGARSIPEARAVLKRRFTRMVGNFSIRAAARLKREVLGIALGGGAAAAKARERAKRFHHNLSNEYGFQHAYGPHGA